MRLYWVAESEDKNMNWQEIKALLTAFLQNFTLPPQHIEPELKPIPIPVEARRPEQRRY